MVIMSPASTKICKLCGVGFRGTTNQEEVHCAKCFVKTCDVPPDTDEQFLKLVTELHGPELATVPKAPSPTDLIKAMMKDILGHKTRLNKLEKDLEKCNRSTKEKNRVKREIYRLREEKREMEGLKEGISAKLMHLALVNNVSSSSVPSQKATAQNHSTLINKAVVKVQNNSAPTDKSVTDSPAKGTPKTATPKTPKPTRVPTNTPVTVSPSSPKVSKSFKPIPFNNSSPMTTPTTPTAPAPISSPPRSPTKQTPQQQPMPAAEAETETTTSPPTSPKTAKNSPVKLTALKFEAAAKKVNNVVTFAKMPSKAKPARSPEVNNNDTPVTASSSSEAEEESDEFEEMIENGKGNPSALTRSNSVRDRIKAFEEIQRRASTGSYDRKRSQQGKANRSLSSMKSINV